MYHNKVSQSLFSSSAPVCGPSIPPPVQPVKPTIKRTKTDRTLEDFPLESLLQGPLQPDTYLQGKTFSTVSGSLYVIMYSYKVLQESYRIRVVIQKQESGYGVVVLLNCR